MNGALRIDLGYASNQMRVFICLATPRACQHTGSLENGSPVRMGDLFART